MLKLRSLFLILAVCGWQTTANAQALTSRQQEILRTVLSAEGYLTQQLHEEFWRQVPIRTQEDLQRFEELISKVLTLAARYQRAAWASARASYSARRPIRLPEIDTLESDLRATMPSPHNARFEESFASTRRLLAAAADRTPLDTPARRMFITPDLIDRVETGLEASLSRMRRLAAARYDDTPVSRKYPMIGATVLSADPLVVRNELVDLPTLAKKVRLTSAEWIVSGNEAAMIGSLTLPVAVTGHARIEKILRAAIEGAKKSAQIQHTTSAWQRWRDNASLVMYGWAIEQGARRAVSARAVYVEPSRRLFLFLAAGPDASSADHRRAAFELSTHIDD